MPTFFDLPAELRDTIYGLAFDGGKNDIVTLKRKTKAAGQHGLDIRGVVAHGLDIRRASAQGPAIRRALTQVNRQCRAETLALCLSTTCFKIFGSMDEVFEWLERIACNPHTRKMAYEMHQVIHDLIVPTPEARRQYGGWETVAMHRTIDGRHIGVFVRDERSDTSFEWKERSDTAFEWVVAFASAQRLEKLKGCIAPECTWFRWPSHVDARDYSQPDGVAVPTLKDVMHWGTPAQVDYARKNMRSRL